MRNRIREIENIKTLEAVENILKSAKEKANTSDEHYEEAIEIFDNVINMIEEEIATRNNFSSWKKMIKEEYDRLCGLTKECHTVAEIRTLADKLNTVIEIGAKGDFGEDCHNKRFDNISDEEIEWFRVEEYGSLEYIYFYTKHSDKEEIRLDTYFACYNGDGEGETLYFDFETLEEIFNEVDRYIKGENCYEE